MNDFEIEEEEFTAEGPYEWVSNGGCTICDSLDGHIFDGPSPAPHPNCNCLVIDRGATNVDCDESQVVYALEFGHALHHTSGVDSNDEFDLVYDYEIRCWGNSDRVSGQVLVTRTYGQSKAGDLTDFFDDALAEALELVEVIAIEECPVCGEHPHVA